MIAKNLVIDASVACAATERITLDQTSKNCCDFLKAVLDSKYDHCLVMTPSIKEEWNSWQSTFTRKWRLAMIAKKRVKPLNIQANHDLRARLDAIAETDIEREAMWKDIILIEAAIATDKIIISRDEKARNPFQKSAISIKELREILWANPDKPEENAIEWLKQGANPDIERLLGFTSH